MKSMTDGSKCVYVYFCQAFHSMLTEAYVLEFRYCDLVKYLDGLEDLEDSHVGESVFGKFSLSDSRYLLKAGSRRVVYTIGCTALSGPLGVGATSRQNLLTWQQLAQDQHVYPHVHHRLEHILEPLITLIRVILQ